MATTWTGNTFGRKLWVDIREQWRRGPRFYNELLQRVGRFLVTNLPNIIDAETITPIRTPVLGAPGAEAGDAITFDVNIEDANGDAVEETVTLLASVINVDGDFADTAAFTIDVGGGGEALVHPAAAGAQVILTTHTDGSATLTVTDISAAFAGNVAILIQVLSSDVGAVAGEGAYVVLTFA